MVYFKSRGKVYMYQKQEDDSNKLVRCEVLLIFDKITEKRKKKEKTKKLQQKYDSVIIILW